MTGIVSHSSHLTRMIEPRWNRCSAYVLAKYPIAFRLLNNRKNRVIIQ